MASPEHAVNTFHLQFLEFHVSLWPHPELVLFK